MTRVLPELSEPPLVGSAFTAPYDDQEGKGSWPHLWERTALRVDAGWLHLVAGHVHGQRPAAGGAGSRGRPFNFSGYGYLMMMLKCAVPLLSSN